MTKLEDGAEEIWTQGVIEQNRRWMLAYLFAVTGDEALAEDLVQETFVIAYQKRAEFRKGEPFGAWLRGIARNLARRHVESRSRGPVLLESETVWNAMESHAAVLEQAHVNPDYHAERLSALRKCVQRLTDRMRGLIEGRYAQGLNLAQLAQKSGLSLSSVPVVLHRARSAVSDCIKKSMALNFSGGGP